MIGNDIVDLEFAKLNSRWQEYRFLDKIFTEEEQDFILASGSRFENIWRLWSMKESAYKISARAEHKIRFNPKDFKCAISNNVQGLVHYADVSVSTLTETSQKFIQTTAFSCLKWTSKVVHFTNSKSPFQHLELKKRTIEIYAELKNVRPESIEIRKNRIGVPQFYVDDILQKGFLSLTHHGNFGAFAITV